MPKPNRFKKNNGYAPIAEYDDYRGGGGGDTRRVSFKPNRNRDRQDRGKDWGASLRSHLEEDDVDMGTNNGVARNINNPKHFKKRGGRSGSPIPPKGVKRRLLEAQWYRITIPFGNKYEKSYILRTLLSNLTPLPLIPICWTVNGTTATFYVDEYKVADKLQTLDREIQYPDGFKMIIRVNCGSPHVMINPDMKEKIKQAMAKRYNASTKALDLARFHIDPDLRDLFCALSKPPILLTVLEIISKNIPEIEAINLHDNRIQVFAFLKKINQQLPNLKILHMGNNKLSDVNRLDPLIGLPVVDLVLDGNPLCDKFKEQDKYIRVFTGIMIVIYCSKKLGRVVLMMIARAVACASFLSVYSEVRKRFPKVIKLDGIDLPPPIGFDIAEEVPLPTSQQTFLCSQDGQGIVRQFLEQYFTIFDSDNRQPLLQAYHENAVFSMTMAYAYGQHPKNSAWLNWYATDSRNVQRVQDSDRRHKLLKQGQLAVVSFLSDMPSSKHDLHSFTVDLTLFTPQMLTLTVTGIFRELRTAHKVPPIRYFFRTLIIVPAGSGFCIANEELHITNATEEQSKIAFKTPIPAPLPPTPEALQVAGASIPPTAVVNVPDEQTKHQMVQTMAQQSGMNFEWSQKCLEETTWDFQRASFVFAELQKQGVIPPEAFVK